MAFSVTESRRLQDQKPYLFDEIDRARRQVEERGVKVIDLSIGDPDMPTPEGIVEVLKKASENPANHKYPPYRGTEELRKSISSWYERIYGVDVDPDKEVLVLIGSKDGIAHIPLAFIDYGDYSLVPDPGYPVYSVATEFAAGIVYRMPLLPENGFVPKLSQVPSNVARRAKIMFLNYPNNPTSALGGKDLFIDAVQFARKYNVIVCNDAAYSTLVFDEKPRSLLQTAGAKQIGIEFHSMSKMFNMTGWRVGFAVGNSEVIGALAKLKTNIDSGVFKAVQSAAAHALENFEKYHAPILDVYKRRVDIVCNLLEDAGIEFDRPKGTFYVWCKVPAGEGSMDFCKRLLEKTGVVATPGVGFGSYGEGFFRLSLTAEDSELTEACNRIKQLMSGEEQTWSG